jgi:hypothetical protein
MKESLFFIVFKHNDELVVNRAFSTLKDAKDYFNESVLSKKLCCIKEAVYTIKDKKK